MPTLHIVVPAYGQKIAFTAISHLFSDHGKMFRYAFYILYRGASSLPIIINPQRYLRLNISRWTSLRNRAWQPCMIMECLTRDSPLDLKGLFSFEREAGGFTPFILSAR
jgi:hypothetical protein